MTPVLVARALGRSKRKLLRDWRRRGKPETRVGRDVPLASYLVLEIYFPRHGTLADMLCAPSIPTEKGEFAMAEVKSGGKGRYPWQRCSSCDQYFPGGVPKVCPTCQAIQREWPMGVRLMFYIPVCAGLAIGFGVGRFIGAAEHLSPTLCGLLGMLTIGVSLSALGGEIARAIYVPQDSARS